MTGRGHGGTPGGLVMFYFFSGAELIQCVHSVICPLSSLYIVLY